MRQTGAVPFNRLGPGFISHRNNSLNERFATTNAFGISRQHLFSPCWSAVAQLVEQVAVNHPVAGSSPARGANKNKGLEVN